MDVTAIILTKNEELNLPDCIKSLDGFVKRIVVVDSYSTDNTVKIASSMGADVYQNVFVNNAIQFNWALDNVSIDTKWTLRLDADEMLTPILCDELSKLMSEHDCDEVNGIIIEARLFFMGKEIKHGCHNKRKLKLFKTGFGRSEQRNVDEHNILLSGKSIYSKNKFIHYDYKDLTNWINKMNWYASRETQDYFEFIKGKNEAITGNDHVINITRKMKYGVYYKLPLFFRSWLLFIYNYFFKLGFLDGKEGFVYHWMYHRWYRCLVDAKILEKQIANKTFEKIDDQK